MFPEVFHYRDRTTVGNKIGTHLSRGKKANNAVFPVETREWASSCTYTHVHVRSTRPRNHRGQLEILTEHEFMTVSSVYVARERPGRNNKDGQREMVHAEREQEISKGTWWMRGTEPRNEEEGVRNSKRKDEVRERVYVVVRRETRGEEFRWRKMEEEGERRKKVVWRRVFREGQVELVWRTEVLYDPRKPAAALKPFGLHTLSFPSFSFLLVRTAVIYHLRGSVIPSRLRVSDPYTYSPTRNNEGSTNPGICAYNRLQTHLLRSYSFVENYWLCHVWGVRETLRPHRSIVYIRDPWRMFPLIRSSRSRNRRLGYRIAKGLQFHCHKTSLGCVSYCRYIQFSFWIIRKSVAAYWTFVPRIITDPLGTWRRLGFGTFRTSKSKSKIL